MHTNTSWGGFKGVRGFKGVKGFKGVRGFKGVIGFKGVSNYLLYLLPRSSL